MNSLYITALVFFSGTLCFAQGLRLEQRISYDNTKDDIHKTETLVGLVEKLNKKTGASIKIYSSRLKNIKVGRIFIQDSDVYSFLMSLGKIHGFLTMNTGYNKLSLVDRNNIFNLSDTDDPVYFSSKNLSLVKAFKQLLSLNPYLSLWISPEVKDRKVSVTFSGILLSDALSKLAKAADLGIYQEGKVIVVRPL